MPGQKLEGHKLTRGALAVARCTTSALVTDLSGKPVNTGYGGRNESVSDGLGVRQRGGAREVFNLKKPAMVTTNLRCDRAHRSDRNFTGVCGSWRAGGLTILGHISWLATLTTTW